MWVSEGGFTGFLFTWFILCQLCRHEIIMGAPLKNLYASPAIKFIEPEIAVTQTVRVTSFSPILYKQSMAVYSNYVHVALVLYVPVGTCTCLITATIRCWSLICQILLAFHAKISWQPSGGGRAQHCKALSEQNQMHSLL